MKIRKPRLKEFVSNTATVTAVLASVKAGMVTLGVPVHEKYPPTIVLKPQRKFPYLKPMRGRDYYRQLLEDRKRGKP